MGTGGTVVRPLRESDLEACGEVMEAAYGPGRRLARLRRYWSVEPDGWLVAERGGAVAALGGVLRYRDQAYLGLMAVHPAEQRRGLGEAILRRLLAGLDAAGVVCVRLDATAAGEPLYARHGFVAVGETRVVALDGGGGAGPAGPAGFARGGPRIEQGGLSDLRSCAEYDRTVFGAPRRALLLRYLSEFPEGLWLARGAGGALCGYALRQDAVLGPVMADTPEIARDLVVAAAGCRQIATAGGLVAGIVCQNPAAPRLFEGLEARTLRSVTHMVRGEPGRAAPDEARLYARASQAAG